FDGGLAGVSNLDGKVTFDSLLPPRTADAQHLTADLRIASLPPGPLDLRFDLPGRDRLVVDRATLGLAGGTLSLTGFALERGQPLALDRSPGGDGSLLVGLKGNNPAVLDGHPFDINTRLDANFDRLAAIFLSGYAAAEGMLRSAAGR